MTPERIIRPPRPGRSEEKLAAQIVAGVTAVEAKPLDRPGAGDGLADFQLVDQAGVEVGLLEVTSVMDDQLNSTLNSLSKKAPRDVPGSRLFWAITLDGRCVGVNRLRSQLRSILGELEAGIFADHGQQNRLWVVSPDEFQPEASKLAAETNHVLFELGVRVVFAVPAEPDEQGVVAFSTQSSVKRTLAGAITTAVNVELLKRDNRAKLAKAGEGQRAEMFVWLDKPDLRMAAIRAGQAQPYVFDALSGSPELPDEITAVWAAPTSGIAGELVSFYSDGGPWQIRRSSEGSRRPIRSEFAD